MEFTVIDATVVRSNRPSRIVPPKRGAVHVSVVETDCGACGSDRAQIAEFEDVERLDLSCLNILHIANLSLLSPTNLTSLKLSVNRIDRICNLDHLTCLVDLDLSHNHIKHIENLQGLVNLQRLILNHNPLTKVHNLESQRDSLEMLDISCCKIADLKFTLYLKQFANLVSLIVEGNPFRIEPVDSERTFMVSVLQSLLVYNNKTVTAEEKNEAHKTYSKLIEILEMNESKRRRSSEVEKLRLQRMDGRKRAFLDRIPESEDVDFNVSVFCNPTVEEVLKENGRYGIHNVYRHYAEEFRRLVSEVTTAAEKSREYRERMVDAFRDKLRQSVDDGVNESRKCVSKFDSYRKRLERDLSDCGKENVVGQLCRVESPQDEFVSGQVESKQSFSSRRTKAVRERFDRRTRVAWLTLMGHEDSMSRKISAMIDELRDVLEKQIAEFKQVVNDQFGVLQRQQNVFLQFVLEYAMSSAQVNDINNRFCRLSRFTNDISQCMESQALQMERAESYIINSASKWLDDVFDDLNGGEIQRNRRMVSEIAAFIRFQKETFEHKLI